MTQTLIGFVRGVEICVHAKEASTGLKPSCWESLEEGYQSGGWLESLCEAEMHFSVNLWTPGRWQIYSTFRPGPAIRALRKEIKLPKLTVLCSSQHIALQLKAWFGRTGYLVFPVCEKNKRENTNGSRLCSSRRAQLMDPMCHTSVMMLIIWLTALLTTYPMFSILSIQFSSRLFIYIYYKSYCANFLL